MRVDEGKLLGLGLRLLRLGFAHPNQSRALLLVAASTLITRFSSFYLIFKLIAVSGNDFNVIMDCMFALSSHMQGLTKLALILIYKDNLRYLLESLEKFWPSNHPKEFSFWYRVLSIFLLPPYLTYASIHVFALMKGGLLFASYVPDFPYAFQILLLGQEYQFFFDIAYVVGLDTFFICACIVIRKQFELLQENMKTFNGVTDRAELQMKFVVWIEHHNFMLKYTECVIEAFGYALLLQYGMSTFSICVQLYCLTEKTDLKDVMQSAIYMLSITAQLAWYCFPADAVAQSASDLAKSALNTNWYDFPDDIRKYIVIIVCRSQKPLEFKAGNMLPITREAYTLIFKSSFSFYTLLKQMKH